MATATSLLLLAILLASCDSAQQQAGTNSSPATPTNESSQTVVISPTSGVLTNGSEGDAPHHYGQCTIAYAKSLYDQAIQECTAAIKLDPNNIIYYKTRADIYYHEKDYDNEFTDYKQVVALDLSSGEGKDAIKPDLILAYQRIGTVNYIKGQYNDAVANLTMSINLSADFPTVYETRGDSYKALGDTSKAAADYQAALDLDSKLAGEGYFHLAPQDRQRIEQKLAQLKLN